MEYSTDYSSYNREDVIQLGALSYRKVRLIWRLIGFISLGLVTILDVLAIVDLGLKVDIGLFDDFDRTNIEALIVFSALSIGFAIFAIIFSFKVKGNQLLSGCLFIEKNIRNHYASLTRESKKSAIKQARLNHKEVYEYTKYSTNFSGHTLYEYLLKGGSVPRASVQTINATDLIPIKEPKQNSRSVYRDDGHNFDDVLTDEEFDDLMD